MPVDDVVAVAQAGERVGCKEALFTLGDKPELRYPRVRRELAEMGYDSTISYLVDACQAVLDATGLLPHVNAGVIGARDLSRLREVSVSQGLMLESASERLCEKGGPHFGSPDKRPAARLETIRLAGELAIPFTSGILIGIGETPDERLQALQALADLHGSYGHIQEVIIQNFRAKPGTRMAGASEPDIEELLWSVRAARSILGPDMVIQAPPNLSPDHLPSLIEAGVDDWGGVSPLTIDYVNPEAPWPHLTHLRDATATAGRLLVERLAVQPDYALEASKWVSPGVLPHLLRQMDSEGLARTGDWTAGSAVPFPPAASAMGLTVSPEITDAVARARSGEALDEREITMLFAARGADYEHICEAADEVRAEVNGEVVSYVVTRNINYTNICTYSCTFCAFSKGRGKQASRDLPYDLDLAEVARRAGEAWERGATEVCMQGGIHPSYTGETYLALLNAVKVAAPDLHVHAFSPLEISQGAATLGMPLEDYLRRLRDAGLASLPGTAAEVLDDEVRSVLCPDKLTTQEWLDVIATAHEVGLRTTATIMFGHMERPRHWGRHLLQVRALQQRTGGFTEFVPLAFVHPEAPLYQKGRARKGPSAREAVLMHAVARLALHPHVPNIQTSWVKMGRDGASACLQAGANDLGGTLMNESITRAAGSVHGQEMTVDTMERLIRSLGRSPRQRTTLYGDAPVLQRERAKSAAELAPIIQTGPVKRRVPAQSRLRTAHDTDVV